MDTIKRVEELAAERELTLYSLSLLCDVPYSTLRNTKKRSGQLTVSTIEMICQGLGITMSLFFEEKEPVNNKIRPQRSGSDFETTSDGMIKKRRKTDEAIDRRCE